VLPRRGCSLVLLSGVCRRRPTH